MEKPFPVEHLRFRFDKWFALSFGASFSSIHERFCPCLHFRKFRIKFRLYISRQDKIYTLSGYYSRFFKKFLGLFGKSLNNGWCSQFRCRIGCIIYSRCRSLRSRS